MSIFLLLLKNYWKPILAVVLVVGVYFYIYESGVSHGKNVCAEEHVKIDKAREEALQKKLEKLTTESTNIVNASKKSTAELNKEIRALATSVKVPLIIYKDGVCAPSETFVKTLNDMTEQANNVK